LDIANIAPHPILDIANIANMGIAPHPILDIANIANMDIAPIQYPRLTDIRMTSVAVKPSLSHFQ